MDGVLELLTSRFNVPPLSPKSFLIHRHYFLLQKITHISFVWPKILSLLEHPLKRTTLACTHWPAVPSISASHSDEFYFASNLNCHISWWEGEEAGDKQVHINVERSRHLLNWVKGQLPQRDSSVFKWVFITTLCARTVHTKPAMEC
jgi:hypothetical protein